MLFENPPKNIESLIAKSADLTNKPFGWIAIMGKNATHQNTALDWKI